MIPKEVASIFRPGCIDFTGLHSSAFSFDKRVFGEKKEG
jgi:hypothetical protein